MLYKEMHLKAIELYEEYNISNAIKEDDKDNQRENQQILFNAYTLEKKAALSFIKENNLEPTRTILLKGAINFAYQLKMYEEAKNLLDVAMAGDPPYNQLKDLLKFKTLIEKNLDGK